jgi:hypothetical protein
VSAADTSVDAGGSQSQAAGPADRAGLVGWWRSIDRSAWTTVGVLAVAFVASRAAYKAAGVVFNAAFLPLAQQHLELRHLEDRLLESLWYQHTQPPLFNLLLGLALKSPLPFEATLHAFYLGLGAALLGLSYVLLRDLAVSRWWAVGAAIVLCCGPTVVLYEHWPSYEYPLAVLVTGLAVASLRWARTGATRWLAAAVGLAAACTLTRVLFNPAWFALLVALLLVARRPAGREWRAAGVVVALPTVLILGLMAKNLVLFDTPLFSSWGGWNLQRVTVDELPDGRLEELIADGTLTPMARIPVQLSLESYAAETEPCVPAHPDVPVLAEERKSNGWENFNHECYLPITSEALDNAIAAGLAEPRNTARVWVASFQIWGEPASLYAFVYDNRLQVETLDTWYRQLVLLDVPWDPPVQTDAAWYLPLGTPGGDWRFSLSILLGTLLAVALGGRSAWRIVRGRGSARDTQLAVIGLTVLTVTLTGNLLEIGENNRFRFVVEPVTLIVLFATLAQLGRKTRRKAARSEPQIA